jgi:L-asparagine transporter-like permease
MDAESVAGVASSVVVADFITFLATNSACNAALFSTFALLFSLYEGEVGGGEGTGRLGGSLGWGD